MQPRVLLVAGAVVLVVGGALAFRSVTHQKTGQAVDHGIETLLGQLPPGTTIRHGESGYNALTGTLTVHDLVLTTADAAMIAADTLTVSGADPQALHDIAEPAAYPGGHPAWTARRLLIADLALTGIHITSRGPNDQGVEIRSITLHRLSGRPFALPPTPDNRRKRDWQADAALAFALDSVEVRSLKTAATGPRPNSMTIGTFAVSDYDGGQIGSAQLKDLAIEAAGKPHGGTVHVTLAGIDLKGADLRALLQSVQRTGHADQHSLSLTSYTATDIDGLAMDIGHGPRLSVDRVHGEQTAADADGQTVGRGTVHGLTLAIGSLPVPPNAQPLVAAFGMTAITADIEAVSRGHRAAGQSELTEDISLHELGKLHVQAAISGYDSARAEPGKPMAALMATSIDHASLTWDDASLTSRVMAVAAAQLHTTPELIKAQLAMPVVTLGLMVPDQPDVADQVTAFLNNPQTLTVTATPPGKITLGEVAAAPVTSRAHLLGLHITGR